MITKNKYSNQVYVIKKAPGTLSVLFRRVGWSDKRNRRGVCSLGTGDAHGRHLLNLIPFLVFFKEVLFRSGYVYSEMVAVQLDEVYRALVGSDVLKFVIGEESFRDVVD